MKKSKKRIIGGILTAICVILSLYIAINIIVASNQDRPPRIFGVSISYVPTNSMSTTIEPGDYVLFKKTDFDSVEVNDIIVYRSKQGEMAGKYIIHRVKEIKDGFLITQGDNNPTPDTEKITPDMVYGKFICVIGFLNAFSGFNRNAIFVFLVIIFVILFSLQVISVFLKWKKDKISEKNNKLSEIDLEQLKKEILEEELAKIRNQQNKKDE